MDYIDVDCVDLTSRYANDVIASYAFGLKVDSHSDVNNEFFTTGREISTFGFQRVLVFLGYSAFPWLMRVSHYLKFIEHDKWLNKALFHHDM